MMSRCSAFFVLGLAFVGFACQDTTESASPTDVLAGLTAREAAYHSSVTALSSVRAIQCEAAAYAGDMHDLLDAMREACRESGRGMMGGYTQEGMIELADEMHACIDRHLARLKAMEMMELMIDECREHHAIATELLEDMRRLN